MKYGGELQVQVLCLASKRTEIPSQLVFEGSNLRRR
jgi:hypothetical protein